MPSFISVSFLLAVIAAGAALSAVLLLVTVAVRAGRRVLAGGRARREEQVRPLVLRAVMGEAVPDEAVAARGWRGRAVERVAFSYLAHVRGEGHALLAALLQRRGVVTRAIGRSYWPSANRRAAAAGQLGLIATADAGRQLEYLATTDPSRRVRIVAARGLGKTGEPAAVDTLLSLLPARAVPDGVVASALVELGAEAGPALRRAAADPALPAGQRAMAADLLGLLDELIAYPDLTACLASPDPQLRLSAVRALGRLGLPQATGAVLGCLEPGGDPGLRAAAAQALGRIGDRRAAPALARCLADPDYWIAHRAAEALAALGPPGQRVLTAAVADNRPGARYAREALSWAAVGAAGAAAGLPAGRPR